MFVPFNDCIEVRELLFYQRIPSSVNCLCHAVAYDAGGAYSSTQPASCVLSMGPAVTATQVSDGSPCMEKLLAQLDAIIALHDGRLLDSLKCAPCPFCL